MGRAELRLRMRRPEEPAERQTGSERAAHECARVLSRARLEVMCEPGQVLAVEVTGNAFDLIGGLASPAGEWAARAAGSHFP